MCQETSGLSPWQGSASPHPQKGALGKGRTGAAGKSLMPPPPCTQQGQSQAVPNLQASRSCSSLSPLVLLEGQEPAESCASLWWPIDPTEGSQWALGCMPGQAPLHMEQTSSQEAWVGVSRGAAASCASRAEGGCLLASTGSLLVGLSHGGQRQPCWIRGRLWDRALLPQLELQLEPSSGPPSAHLCPAAAWPARW